MEGKNKNRSPIVLPIRIKKLETTEKEMIKNKKAKANLFFDGSFIIDHIPKLSKTTTVKMTKGLEKETTSK